MYTYPHHKKYYINLFRDDNDTLFLFLTAKLAMRKINIATTIADNTMVATASVIGRISSLKAALLPSSG